MKDWSSPIYVFFGLTPSIMYVDGWWSHDFKCLGKGCKQTVWWFLDKCNRGLTGNMHKHIKAFHSWGEDVFNLICNAPSLESTRNTVVQYQSNGSITSALNIKEMIAVTFPLLPSMITHFLWLILASFLTRTSSPFIPMPPFLMMAFISTSTQLGLCAALVPI